MIINMNSVKKYYAANLVLADVNLEIREGERVGLIGRNGAGKTTIFKMITGEFAPDGGLLTIRRGTKVGCLAQIPDYQDETTVYEVLGRGYAAVRKCKVDMGELEVQMTRAEVYEDEKRLQKVLAQYDQLREAFERGGGYEMEAHIEMVARGLGVPQAQYQRPFASLSGGEKTKVGLAALLIEKPDLLLLDEPTNHLDMKAIEWLEQFLLDYDGTVVVISHDRYFLDKVVTKVIEIEDGEAFTYHANYSGYQTEKEERLMREFAQYQEQQKKIKQMKEAIKQLIDWGNRGNPPNPSFHRRAASMQKALDRMEKLKRPILERKAIDLKLEQNDRSGKRVAVLEEIAKTYGQRRLFQGVSEVLTYGDRVFLIGDNGAGKSTIFKMLLGKETPDEGAVRLGSRVEVGYLAQEEAPHEETKTVLQFFRDEVKLEEGQARYQLTRFLFYGSDCFKAVRSLSGGEWTRLRLALLMHRRPNLLLLDEPTNHLDIDSREALEEALEEFQGTILAISHDRYFINKLAEKVWALENGQLTTYLGDFEYYKEKRAEFDAVQVAEEEAAVAVKPAPMPAAEEPKAKKKVNEFQKAKLEQDIAGLEQRLKAFDEAIADPENSTDAGKLDALVTNRDAAQTELDRLLEKWLEFEE